MNESGGEILVLGGAEVRALMSYAQCIEEIEHAMRIVSRGGAVLPLRVGARAARRETLVAAMPGFLDDPPTLGGKIIAVNRKQTLGMSSHQGVIVLFDVNTGTPLAILEASSITALRTAAASAVATRSLARSDSARLAILGAGEQAEAHIRALTQVMPFDSVAIWSRTLERAHELVGREAGELALPMTVHAAVEDAIDGADVICTTTAATDPILQGAWIRPGTHVNLVGSSSLEAREVDDALVLASRFFVDFRASAMAQAGELAHAFASDPVRMAGHIRGEIGEVLNGACGRNGTDEVTVYKSLGIAAQDLAAARFVYDRARLEGVGVPVRL
jgi:ornithine cyclodeaminase/alanine dehydrogenase-like protein (mu-crystallin family)